MLTHRPAQATASATGPGLGLLAALGAWTWAGTDPAGQGIAHILLAHPPGRTGHDTPQAIEARMRHIAGCLGGLADPLDAVPDLGERLQVAGCWVLLRFPGARYGMRLPSHPRWTDLVTSRRQAVLLVGLNPLTRSADATRVDAYLDSVLAADRLLFGLVRTA
ncbi:hypothetical protein NGB36_15425 [Streptomyces sp. RB6PN25]|uniref:Uncharacterized protein n=1 Tax=Streptomyces humicola TaxID=2953240 RepID=A0ABT1PWA1_9ACTN|nr:hypothetical protein [Streptomyces humicola]MCQ4081961.1 hypothetical protein [Streptomyces humicola]